VVPTRKKRFPSLVKGKKSPWKKGPLACPSSQKEVKDEIWGASANRIKGEKKTGRERR